MSAETGSGIGMGAVAGVGGITGGGIGTSAGSLGSGIGLEGGSIGMTSAIGSISSIATAEIGSSFSLNDSITHNYDAIGGRTIVTANPFVGTEVFQVSPSLPGISMDTTIPGIGKSFDLSNYGTIWTADSPASASFEPISSTQTQDFSETFTDIGNFLNQSPAPASEAPGSVFRDIHAFFSGNLSTTTDVFNSEVPSFPLYKSENNHGEGLSPADKASLQGLFSRIEGVIPETTDNHSTSQDSFVDVAPMATDPIGQVITRNEQLFAPEVDTIKSVMEEVVASPETVQTANVENIIVQNLESYVGKAEASKVDAETENEVATGLATKSLPVIVSEEEITADIVQAEKIIDLLGTIRDLDEKTVSMIREDALDVLEKRHGGVSKQGAVVAEIEPDSDEQALKQTVTAQVTSLDVETGNAVATATLTDVKATATVQNITAEVEDHDKPEEEKEDKQPKYRKTAILDEATNAKRVKKITDAFSEAEKVVTKQHEEAGIPSNAETIVPGDVAAHILVKEGIERDDEAKSEIVPEDDIDGTIIHTLNELAQIEIVAGEIRTGTAKSSINGIVENHPSVAIDYEPYAANEDQIREVFDDKARKNSVIFYAPSRMQKAEQTLH